MVSSIRKRPRGRSSRYALSIIRGDVSKVVINDVDFENYLGRYLYKDEARCYTLPTYLYKAVEYLKNNEMGLPLPSWFHVSATESLWYSRERFKNRNGAMWLFSDTAILISPYCLSLDWGVHDLEEYCSDISFDPNIDGWLLRDIEIDEDSIEIIKELSDKYGFSLSPGISSSLDGSVGWHKKLSSFANRAKEQGMDIPRSFRTSRELREHQQMAVLSMAYNGASILADQVGLGKGGEFISGALTIAEWKQKVHNLPKSDCYPFAIITPASMKMEIAEEIEKWNNDAVIQIISGKTYTDINPEAQFVVLNIDILADHVDSLIEAGVKGFVIDEAHMVKNLDAKRTQAALKLSEHIRSTEKYPYIVLASGTPFTNRPNELWALLVILGLGETFADYARERLGNMVYKGKNRWNGKQYTSSYTDKMYFEARWCNGHQDKYYAWQNDGATNTAELNELLLKHGMVRRKKSDVMHPMPELEEQVVAIRPTKEQKSEYDEIKNEFLEWMINEVKSRADQIMEEEGLSLREALRITYMKVQNAEAIMKMTKLRQKAAQIKIDETINHIHKFMSGELEYEKTNEYGRKETVRVGDDPDRRKLIVFAYHKEIQEALINDPELQEYGMVYLTGDNKSEHQEMKFRFQRDPDTRLIICYSGAREGHTLTAAKDVLLAEIPFVPSWVVQMAGRCWARFSEEYEPHEATIWYTTALGTIDTEMMRRVRNKKIIFNQVIDNEGQEDVDKNNNDYADREEAAELLIDMIMNGETNVGIAA